MKLSSVNGSIVIKHCTARSTPTAACPALKATISFLTLTTFLTRSTTYMAIKYNRISPTTLYLAIGAVIYRHENATNAAKGAIIQCIYSFFSFFFLSLMPYIIRTMAHTRIITTISQLKLRTNCCFSLVIIWAMLNPRQLSPLLSHLSPATSSPV